jgi:hypothetical protein
MEQEYKIYELSVEVQNGKTFDESYNLRNSLTNKTITKNIENNKEKKLFISCFRKKKQYWHFFFSLRLDEPEFENSKDD